LVGKTNMHELGLGITGFNPHYGPARNPYNLHHVTGGSSSGSAAAVAAGLCPVALGADGGGSVRIPAGFCGLVGIKPTFGRVPGGAIDPTLSVVGPLAGHLADAALVYATATATSLQVRTPQMSELRLGIFRPWFEHAQPEVVAACRSLLDQFVERGARLVEISLPDLNLARVAQNVTIASEVLAYLGGDFLRYREQMGLELQVNLGLARRLSALEFLAAQQVRQRARASLDAAFDAVDIIVSPTTACAAPALSPSALPLGESDLATVTEVIRFTFLANLTGHPAVAVPAGYTAAGLPLSLQLMGRPWEEAALIGLAGVAEGLVPRRRPERFFDLLQ
jgi:Asp-tRNA(Asn)/Glu-tRNA(Gln) amidotransferase A subunit family amidase